MFNRQRIEEKTAKMDLHMIYRKLEGYQRFLVVAKGEHEKNCREAIKQLEEIIESRTKR